MSLPLTAVKLATISTTPIYLTWSIFWFLAVGVFYVVFPKFAVRMAVTLAGITALDIVGGVTLFNPVIPWLALSNPVTMFLAFSAAYACQVFPAIGHQAYRWLTVSQYWVPIQLTLASTTTIQPSASQTFVDNLRSNKSLPQIVLEANRADLCLNVCEYGFKGNGAILAIAGWVHKRTNTTVNTTTDNTTSANTTKNRCKSSANITTYACYRSKNSSCWELPTGCSSNETEAACDDIADMCPGNGSYIDTIAYTDVLPVTANINMSLDRWTITTFCNRSYPVDCIHDFRMGFTNVAICSKRAASNHTATTAAAASPTVSQVAEPWQSLGPGIDYLQRCSSNLHVTSIAKNISKGKKSILADVSNEELFEWCDFPKVRLPGGGPPDGSPDGDGNASAGDAENRFAKWLGDTAYTCAATVWNAWATVLGWIAYLVNLTIGTVDFSIRMVFNVIALVLLRHQIWACIKGTARFFFATYRLFIECSFIAMFKYYIGIKTGLIKKGERLAGGKEYQSWESIRDIFNIAEEVKLGLFAKSGLILLGFFVSSLVCSLKALGLCLRVCYTAVDELSDAVEDQLQPKPKEALLLYLERTRALAKCAFDTCRAPFIKHIDTFAALLDKTIADLGPDVTKLFFIMSLPGAEEGNTYEGDFDVQHYRDGTSEITIDGETTSNKLRIVPATFRHYSNGTCREVAVADFNLTFADLAVCDVVLGAKPSHLATKAFASDSHSKAYSNMLNAAQKRIGGATTSAVKLVTASSSSASPAASSDSSVPATKNSTSQKPGRSISTTSAHGGAQLSAASPPTPTGATVPADNQMMAMMKDLLAGQKRSEDNQRKADARIAVVEAALAKK